MYSTFDNPFTKPEVREKIRRTTFDRYGVTCALMNTDIQEKRKFTMLQRYGATSTFGSSSLRHKFNFKEMAKKRHITMKCEGTYKKSREEDDFARYLEKFGNIERNKIIDGRWPIDFYLVEYDVYVQYDGVYWHGLDRPINIIAEHSTKRDVMIHKKWLTDREQESWFKEHDMRLIRVPSSSFNRKNFTCLTFEQILSIF